MNYALKIASLGFAACMRAAAKGRNLLAKSANMFKVKAQICRVDMLNC